MSAFRMRLAKLEDMEALLKIEQSCFKSDRFSKRQFSYLLTQAKALTWVMVLKGELCAYCIALLPEIGRPARIYSLAVLPEHQGKGLAHKLIARALNEMASRHYEACVLEVRENAVLTIALYQKHGFTITKQLKSYYEDNENALRMIKTFDNRFTRRKLNNELV